MWETLIFGTGDWFAFGEPFFCGLFTPTNPLPGHRFVPESHDAIDFFFVFLEILKMLSLLFLEERCQCLVFDVRN